MNPRFEDLFLDLFRLLARPEFHHHTETGVVGAGGGRESMPGGRTAGVRIATPRAATEHAQAAGGVAGIHVAAPFPDVAVHVKEAVGVRGETADARRCLGGTTGL